MRPCSRSRLSHIVPIMDLNSPLFDRIRTRRDAKPTPTNASGPRCQHPGCHASGEFRAPMGRLREGQYFSFCLDHVREYNATYNYFNGMSDEAVLSYQKDALTGHRPTWKMGSSRQDESGFGMHDPSFVRAAHRLLRIRLGLRDMAWSPERRSYVLGLDDEAERRKSRPAKGIGQAASSRRERRRPLERGQAAGNNQRIQYVENLPRSLKSSTGQTEAHKSRDQRSRLL